MRVAFIAALVLVPMAVLAQNPPANPPTTTVDPTNRACTANSVLNYIPSGELFTCQNGTYQRSAGPVPSGTGVVVVSGGVATAIGGTQLQNNNVRNPTLIDDTAHGSTLVSTPIWVNNSTGDVFSFLNATNGAASWARLVPNFALPLDVSGTNVQAAYSVRQLRSAYAGNAMTITRASGSPATQALGFVNGYVDMATAASFCAGTTCSVTTWNDQSGGAKDCTQATLANAPTFLIDTLGNGATVTFDGSVTNQYCTMPAAVAVTLPNLSMAVVTQPQRIYTGQNILNLGPTGGNEFGMVSFANASTFKTPSLVASDPFGTLGGPAIDNGPLVAGIVQNGSTATMWVNESSASVAVTGSNFALTGGQIGFETLFNSPFSGSISTVIIKSSAFSATERSNVWNSLYRLHGIAPQYAQNTWVALGDSIPAGTGTVGSDGWPTLASKQMNIRMVDVGVPGVTCATLDTNFAAFTAILKSSTARNNPLTISCGTNDLLASATAAATWGHIQSMITQGVSAGFTVAPSTVPPCTSCNDTVRLALNVLITNGWQAAGASALIPFASSPVMGQTGQNTNTTYYNADGVHPNAFGAAVLAQIALAVVQPFLQR